MKNHFIKRISILSYYPSHSLRFFSIQYHKWFYFVTSVLRCNWYWQLLLFCVRGHQKKENYKILTFQAINYENTTFFFHLYFKLGENTSLPKVQNTVSNLLADVNKNFIKDGHVLKMHELFSNISFCIYILNRTFSLYSCFEKTYLLSFCTINLYNIIIDKYSI